MFKITSISLSVVTISAPIPAVSIITPVTPVSTPAVLILFPRTTLPPLVPPFSRPTFAVVASPVSPAMSDLLVRMMLIVVVAVVRSSDVLAKCPGERVMRRLVCLTSGSRTNVAPGTDGLGFHPATQTTCILWLVPYILFYSPVSSHLKQIYKS